MLFSGYKFKKKYRKTFVKLTNGDENHNGFQYTTGLNVDMHPMDENECVPGGLYFTQISKKRKWAHYGGQCMCFIRRVEVPDDARVYAYDNKFKADKIILGERQVFRCYCPETL